MKMTPGQRRKGLAPCKKFNKFIVLPVSRMNERAGADSHVDQVSQFF
ncbi:MAG: hypothetical protein MUF81_03555 [Verrucomicrobia bacterium]|nr:hypothetical protein [Verrucomicrobiota bacterium]